MICSYSTMRTTNIFHATRGEVRRLRVGTEPRVLAELPAPGACRSITYSKGVKEPTAKLVVQMYSTGDKVWVLELDDARRPVGEWQQLGAEGAVP